MKTEIIYGIHPVSEALAANRREFYEIYLDKAAPSGRIAKLASLAQSKNIPQKVIGPGDFKTLVGAVRHQGIGARVSSYPLATIGDIVEAVQAGEDQPFLLLLDNIQDPQNLGAIIRTALGVGVDGIVVPKDRSASPSPAVSKASAGALEHIRLARVTNLVQTIQNLKKKQLWIIGLEKDAIQSIYGSDLTGAVGIVIGGEQKGLRPLVKKNCDFSVSIPQQGPVESLNASAAAAVALYETFRQRSASSK